MAKLIQDEPELLAISAAFFGSVIDERAVEANRAELACLDATKNQLYDELVEESEDDEEDKKPFGRATTNGNEAGPSGGVIDIPSASDSSSDSDIGLGSDLEEYLNCLDGK